MDLGLHVSHLLSDGGRKFGYFEIFRQNVPDALVCFTHITRFVAAVLRIIESVDFHTIAEAVIVAAPIDLTDPSAFLGHILDDCLFHGPRLLRNLSCCSVVKSTHPKPSIQFLASDLRVAGVAAIDSRNLGLGLVRVLPHQHQGGLP